MAVRGRLKLFANWLLDLVYPPLCEVCGRRLMRGERIMCLACELDLPRTDTHLEPFNIIHQRLATKPPVDRAAAMFYYLRDDASVRLIHNAKYNHRPHIIRELGFTYARELKAAGFFAGIDYIQPVPMHWFKQLLRGYNQTEWLAQGLSEGSGVPCCDNLIVTRHHATQTRKNRLQRWLNARRTYATCDGTDLSGRHVLIVDDVITTGSTIKACAEALHDSVPGITISVLSLALTRLQ